MSAAIILVSTVMHAQNESMQTVINNYIAIKNSLIQNDNKQASVNSELMLNGLEKADNFSEKEKIAGALKKMLKSNDIEKQRAGFEDLSLAVWKLIKNSKTLQNNYYFQYCPMKKAYWVSSEPQVKNPYYGAMMLNCGSVKETKTSKQ
jgi:hypothetical protein